MGRPKREDDDKLDEMDEQEIRRSLEEGLRRAMGDWRQALKWADDDVVLLQLTKIQSILEHLVAEMMRGGE